MQTFSVQGAPLFSQINERSVLKWGRNMAEHFVALISSPCAHIIRAQCRAKVNLKFTSCFCQYSSILMHWLKLGWHSQLLQKHILSKHMRDESVRLLNVALGFMHLKKKETTECTFKKIPLMLGAPWSLKCRSHILQRIKRSTQSDFYAPHAFKQKNRIWISSLWF